MNDEYALHPDVEELLHITPEEKTELDDAFELTRATISEIEDQIVQVAQASPFKATVYIPPYPEAGGAAREDLYLIMEHALGSYRFQWFLDVTRDGLEDSFSRFGDESRTMTFELVEAGTNDQPPQISIRDARSMPTVDGNGQVLTLTQSTVERIPSTYRNVLGWLPETLAGYSE